MTVMRPGLAVILLVGCTKATPPPEPPADDGAQPEEAEEPASEEAHEDVEIDRSPRIEGGLTQEQVDAVVQDHFSGVQKCFDEALVRMETNDLTGAIAIRIEVDGGGAVTEAAVEASNFGDDQTPSCIRDEVAGWSFPGSKKGKPSTVLYPFFLRSY